jgi:hypothetical protein
MKMLSFVLIAVCSLGVLTCETVPAQANDFYGMLQFTDSKTRLTQIVFQRCDSKSLCRKLNESQWDSIRTSCLNCLKEFETCLDVLPDSYKGIYENKPIVFPYLSSREDRIIFFGVPMKDAIRACKLAAKSYETKFNRQATVIMPMDLFK